MAGRGCSLLVLLAAIGGPAVLLLVKDLPGLQGTFPLITLPSGRRYQLDQVPHQKGKVHIITGANSGLGYAAADALARRGAAVVMCCRSLERCQQAASRITRSILRNRDDHRRSGSVRVEELDLGSLASVRQFAQRFLARFDRLDSLMLNAGVMHTPYQLSQDGLELQFAVNHLGHQYLTRLLLAQLQQTGSLGPPARIVSVASNAAFMGYGERGVLLTRDEINSPVGYSAIRAYGQSKLAQIMFTKELQRRLPPAVIALSLNPGAVRTDLPRQWLQSVPSWCARGFGQAYALLTWLGFVWSAERAALTQLWAATSDEARELGGAYLVPIAQVGEPPMQARNASLCNELFEFTDRLIDEALSRIDGPNVDQPAT